MKKLKNYGRVLTKIEQKSIKGSGLTKRGCCDPSIHCCDLCIGPNYSGVGCVWQYADPNPGYPYQNCCV